MNRWGLHHIVVVALLMGGALELIKHFRFAGFSSDDAAMLEDTKPYARQGRLANQNKARAERTKLTDRDPVTFSSPKSKLFIPPQEGQFEATIPKEIAGSITVGQNKKEADAKKNAQAKAKKCRKKNQSQAQAEALRQGVMAGAPPMVHLDYSKAKAAPADGANSEDEVDCQDEENIVKNDNDQHKEEPHNNQEPEPNHGSEGLAAPTLVGGLVIPHSQGGEQIGLEEWKARLLNQPDFKETVRLIEAVQSGQINADLFYTLVKLMLEDNRQEIRELGLLAADRVPSYESFHILISVIKHETFGSRLRVKAEAALAYYQQIGQLSVIERVLSNSNEVMAVIWATRLLDDSARRYLTAHNNKPNNPYAARFKEFVALLELLSRSTKDSGEAAQARQTLQTLQDLLRAFS